MLSRLLQVSFQRSFPIAQLVGLKLFLNKIVKVDNIEKPIKIGYSFVKKSSFTFLSISSITLVSVFSLRSSQLSSLSDTSILTLESPTSSTPSSFSILYSMLLSFISTLVHAGSFKLLTIISN